MSWVSESNGNFEWNFRTYESTSLWGPKAVDYSKKLCSTIREQLTSGHKLSSIVGPRNILWGPQSTWAGDLSWRSHVAKHLNMPQGRHDLSCLHEYHVIGLWYMAIPKAKGWELGTAEIDEYSMKIIERLLEVRSEVFGRLMTMGGGDFMANIIIAPDVTSTFPYFEKVPQYLINVMVQTYHDYWDKENEGRHEVSSDEIISTDGNNSKKQSPPLLQAASNKKKCLSITYCFAQCLVARRGEFRFI